mmetsp:Transcript_29112/g.49622  ORF Transcript_29112/g.49622 Transcript_29112/m.49622 type:complete len:100 (+) Transcript_29112:1356-1655(+)
MISARLKLMNGYLSTLTQHIIDMIGHARYWCFFSLYSCFSFTIETNEHIRLINNDEIEFNLDTYKIVIHLFLPYLLQQLKKESKSQQQHMLLRTEDSGQ